MPHDDQTEVLVRTGWKLFADVTKTDELAVVDPDTRVLSYEKPRRLLKQRYCGKLIKGSHQNVNFRVTPDHPMIVRTWNQPKATLNREFVVRLAGHLGWYSGLLTRIKWEGDNPPDTYTIQGVVGKHVRKRHQADVRLAMSAWLRFLGIYLAEGTMLHRDKGLQIAASKQRERSFVCGLLSEIGIERFQNALDRFAFWDRRFYKALEELGLRNVLAPDKFVPAFVFDQPASGIREFLIGHFYGDGSDSGTGVRRHYTSSRKLAEDLQRLIFLSGDESYVHVRAPRTATMKDGRTVIGRYPEYSVSVCERRASVIQPRNDVTEGQYEGLIVFAEVASNRALVTRREGCILISGSSA